MRIHGRTCETAVRAREQNTKMMQTTFPFVDDDDRQVEVRLRPSDSKDDTVLLDFCSHGGRQIPIPRGILVACTNPCGNVLVLRPTTEHTYQLAPNQDFEVSLYGKMVIWGNPMINVNCATK